MICDLWGLAVCVLRFRMFCSDFTCSDVVMKPWGSAEASLLEAFSLSLTLSSSCFLLHLVNWFEWLWDVAVTWPEVWPLTLVDLRLWGNSRNTDVSWLLKPEECSAVRWNPLKRHGWDWIHNPLVSTVTSLLLLLCCHGSSWPPAGWSRWSL